MADDNVIPFLKQRRPEEKEIFPVWLEQALIEGADSVVLPAFPMPEKMLLERGRQWQR